MPSGLEISIKKNSIKEVINFLKTRKLNIPLLMIENSINNHRVINMNKT